MTAPKAIITGVGGQDGSYLAEWLLARGYHVVGLVRRAPEAYPHIAQLSGRIDVETIDLHDSDAIATLLRRVAPRELYHLAARASSATLFDRPADMGVDNGILVARLLEAVRRESPATRFCQAGSSEMFGDAAACPQSESSGFRPRNPYGAAKVFAHVAVQTYRRHFGLFACGAILFNHESPRRGPEMVTRKIARAAAGASRDPSVELALGDLEARRDWGFAGDYMRALWLMLQHATPDDYVIGSGRLHSVRDVCETAFARVGLDYRRHVRIDPALVRPPEAVPLVGDSRKARDTLGWTPETSFEELIRMMVDAELAALDQPPPA